MVRKLRSSAQVDPVRRGSVRILKNRVAKRALKTETSVSFAKNVPKFAGESKYGPAETISKPSSTIKIEPDEGISPTSLTGIKDEGPLDFRIKYEPFETNPLQVFPKKDESPANIFAKSTLTEEEHSPSNWTQIYNKVVEMRAKFIAPVDTMGCERIPEQINPLIRHSNPKVFRFQLLISLMLSSQTKDEVNYDAVSRLNHYFLTEAGYIDGLCIEAVNNSSESTIDSLIQKVGFHNRKSQYMKKSCELLRDNFDGDIPKTIKEIVTLPGVGPKMGYLLLYKAWNISDGIGVDVHLHRLATMWNWAPKTDKPETTRLALQEWLPKEYWADINPLLVGFGQMVCLPKGNKCDICSLATTGLCKNVNKKVLKLRGDPKRLIDVQKGRGDLTHLIRDIEDLA
ncbi:endonuclease III homolog 2 [[Candida] railenensis]|uniref:Endonuclease III homolog n=1 Tax=[Candida] railenensis TaxID=45579 RepID=A0A9P0VVS1_9ASCO|nr:endonuclease III homolog 2 [[Candida] railenensis]